MAAQSCEARREPQASTLRFSVVLRIRRELREQSAAKSDETASFRPEELVHLLRHSDEANSSTPERCVETYIRDVRKLADGKLSVDDWAHHMLLNFCGQKAARAVQQLGLVLQLATTTKPDALDELHLAFESAQLPCTVRLEAIVELFGHTLRSYCILPREEDMPVELKAFAQGDHAFAHEVSRALDPGSGTSLSCADFMACCLGRLRQQVTLHVYDLSGGRARELSRWLPLPEMDGLWHSGLVVFGTEYFYCGDVICALPGRTAFGPPCKHVSLGHTFRQRSELHQFIVQEIKPMFTREKYNTLHNNCNHFSDRICGWLGCKRVPPDILQQHVKILEAPLAKAVWPVLNHVLGGSSLTSSNMSYLRCHTVVKDPAESNIEVSDDNVNRRIYDHSMEHMEM